MSPDPPGSVAAEVASALEYLHGRRIYHGAVAAENVLLAVLRSLFPRSPWITRLESGKYSPNNCEMNLNDTSTADLWIGAEVCESCGYRKRCELNIKKCFDTAENGPSKV